jgi:hypothetical protein
MQSIRNIALYYFPELGTIKLERLVNYPGNEMWRVARGYYSFRPFFRIDWGRKGWRWTREINYHADYWKELYPQLNAENSRLSNQYSEVLLDSIHALPFEVETVEVCRGDGMILRERKDHWEQMWIHAKGLLHKQENE